MQQTTFAPDVYKLLLKAEKLMKAKKYYEAADIYTKVIAMDPSCVHAYACKGSCAQRVQDYVRAEALYIKAIELDQKRPDTLSNYGSLCKELGLMDKAALLFKRSINTTHFERDTWSNYLVVSQYRHNYSPEKEYPVANIFSELLEKSCNPTTEFKPYNNPKPRIGFVSGDFRIHPVGFLVEELFKNIDKEKFECYLYNAVGFTDELTDRVKKTVTKFKQIDKNSDDAAVKIIKADKIDILFDLSGHTEFNRLGIFARRAAPVQVNWLGYWATTIKNTDYIVVDTWSVKTNEEQFFLEKPYYLPNTRMCYTKPKEYELRDPPCLTNGFITFGCYNNFNKINKEVVKAWSAILHRVKDSKLILKYRTMTHPVVLDHILNMFAEYSLGDNRVILEESVPMDEYYDSYNNIDIALDPFPFTGCITSLDGLWMGVPMITKTGEGIVANQGSAIMNNIGLPYWVTNSMEEYVNEAVERSKDLEALKILKYTLRNRLIGSPLCDYKTFARNFEQMILDLII